MYLPPKGPNASQKWAHFVSAMLITVILIFGLVFLNGVKNTRALAVHNLPMSQLTPVDIEPSPSELENRGGSRRTNENQDFLKPPSEVFGSAHSSKQFSVASIPNLQLAEPAKSTPEKLNVDFVYRISDLDAAPIPIIQGKPRYPRNLVEERIEGRVLAILSVDEDGNVYDVVVEKSDFYEFSESAKSAIMAWKFLPGRKDGQEVKFRMRVPVSFRLLYRNTYSQDLTTTANQDFVRQPY